METADTADTLRTTRPLPSLVEKVPTGIPSFDVIAKGGLPKHRTTLVSGTAGSGKTVLAMQFLAAGIQSFGESGVFVTFEESAPDIRANMRGFGWDLDAWEREGRLAFVDASPDPDVETVESGAFDLGALLARIEHAVKKVGATRVAVDSLGAVFSQFSDESIVRRELFRIASALKSLGVTAVLTAERTGGVRSDRAIRRRGVHRRQRRCAAQRARRRECAGARSRSSSSAAPTTRRASIRSRSWRARRRRDPALGDRSCGRSRRRCASRPATRSSTRCAAADSSAIRSSSCRARPERARR